MARGDMTQEGLATEAGFSPAYASRVELGLQNLSLRTMGRIALALDVPMTDLFEGVQPDPATLVNREYDRFGGEVSPPSRTAGGKTRRSGPTVERVTGPAATEPSQERSSAE
jgi:transcriptional regulator with XRE-family HTH domain